jgi:hypothetical protein
MVNAAMVPVPWRKTVGNKIVTADTDQEMTLRGEWDLEMLDEHVSLDEASHLYVTFAWRSHSINGTQPNLPDPPARQALVQLAQRYRGKPNVNPDDVEPPCTPTSA